MDRARTNHPSFHRVLQQRWPQGLVGADYGSLENSARRWRHHEGYARLEAASSIGVLSNTVPSTFWTLFDIYSRPELLNEIRTELQTNALTIDPDTKKYVVDLALIRDSCPRLVSAFQETLHPLKWRAHPCCVQGRGV